MKTFLEIVRNIASEPWSIEDPDITDIESVKSDSPKLVLATQNANSFIFRNHSLPFKKYTMSFTTVKDNPIYNVPSGAITEVICEGVKEPLQIDTDIEKLTSASGKPTKFNINYLNREGKIRLYPTPDKNYQITVKYETFKTAVRGDLEIDNLEKDNDILNVPQEYEDMYLQALYNKTMVYLIADSTDENYEPYEIKFQEAMQTLTSCDTITIAKTFGY